MDGLDPWRYIIDKALKTNHTLQKIFLYDNQIEHTRVAKILVVMDMRQMIQSSQEMHVSWDVSWYEGC